MTAPHDPFGNNPFGEQPFGATPPVAPPTYSAPPAPSSQPANTLATLSLVFAFVFAPVGAVLGHLGLAQIQRTAQPGRRRALAGIVVSYAIIAVVVVAVTAWVILRPNTTTASGGPPAATAAHPIAPADLAKLLPGLEQLKSILQDNDVIPAAPITQLQGAPGVIDHPDCWVDFSITNPRVYQASDVVGVYRIDYKGTSHLAPQLPPYDLELAVVAYVDPDRAAAAARAMASVAGNCEGQTARLTDPSGATHLFATGYPGAEPVNITTVESQPAAGKLVVYRSFAAKANVAIDLLVEGTQVFTPHLADIANAIQAKIPS
jgi:hypothetical protein